MNVGIIGFGRIGAEHAGWIEAASGLHVAAVADATAARRELAARRGLKVYESEEQLLRHDDVEAILIATPTAMHFQHASDALRAGKHVLIEKPMTLTLPEALELVELARSAGKVLSVFQNRRWDADYLTVKSAIASGVFGRVINVESRLGQWASCVGPAAREWHPTWRNEAAFGGGGLYDWGSHFVDQLWRLMLPARPVRLFAQLRGNVWTEDCDDLARVCIDFDNGAVGLVEINTTTTRPLPRWHIDGTFGSADSPFSLEFDTQAWARLTFAPAQGGQPRQLPVAGGGFSESQIWERFAAACRGQGEPAVPVQTVLPTVALLDAARASSRVGRAVPLDPGLEWRE
jgi:predicted dehydrogenase